MWHSGCGFMNRRAVGAHGVTAIRTQHRASGDGAHGGSVMELITRLRNLMRGEEGQDLLEYALLVSLIALVAVASIGLAGTQVNTIFKSIATALTPAA
jgi:pilus assembly protein Flp/PilA